MILSSSHYRQIEKKNVPTSVRYDKSDNWPLLMNMVKAMHCKLDGCQKKTIFKYRSKHQVFLCVNENGCFLDFHSVCAE